MGEASVLGAVPSSGKERISESRRGVRIGKVDFRSSSLVIRCSDISCTMFPYLGTRAEQPLLVVYLAMLRYMVSVHLCKAALCLLPFGGKGLLLST